LKGLQIDTLYLLDTSMIMYKNHSIQKLHKKYLIGTFNLCLQNIFRYILSCLHSTLYLCTSVRQEMYFKLKCVLLGTYLSYPAKGLPIFVITAPLAHLKLGLLAAPQTLSPRLSRRHHRRYQQLSVAAKTLQVRHVPLQ